MSGNETHNFSTMKSYPTAHLSSWFVISMSLFGLSEKLDEFFCFPRATSSFSDWCRAEKMQTQSSYWKAWISSFAVCQCSFGPTLQCVGEKEPFSDWSWFPFASLNTRIAHRWLQVTIPVGEHATAVTF